VRDSDAVALEGFTHLIPFADGHELQREGRTDLDLIRMTRTSCTTRWSGS
jgi:glutaconate CoA-transferase subunit A